MYIMMLMCGSHFVLFRRRKRKCQWRTRTDWLQTTVTYLTRAKCQMLSKSCSRRSLPASPIHLCSRLVSCAIWRRESSPGPKSGYRPILMHIRTSTAHAFIAKWICFLSHLLNFNASPQMAYLYCLLTARLTYNGQIIFKMAVVY